MKKIIAIMICLVLVSCFTSFAEETLTVSSCAGDVKVLYPGEEKPISLKPGMTIKAGSKIITGEESFAQLSFSKEKENLIKVDAETEVVIKLDGADKVELIDGSIFTMLENIKKGQAFRVRTPDAACGARGTGWKTEASGGLTIVSVFDGVVQVRGINEDGTVREDEYQINTGYQRKIVRYSPPGEESMIPMEAYQKMRDVFGLDDKAKKAASVFNRADKKEERREAIMEMKDRDKIQFREDKEDKAASGGKKSISVGP